MKASAGTPSPAPSPWRLLAPLAGAAIVLAVGATISFSASSILSHHLKEEAQARFEARSGYMLASLEHRLNDFSNLILGMQGLFIASAHVSREEFRRYSETLNLQQRLPGLQALSFQRRVARQDKAAFVARVRNDRSLDPQGYPEFAVRPEGERAEYIVIDFIEPMQANIAAFGYDAGTQPGNADAIRLARDTGRVQISEPFGITQNPEGRPRIVLRAPVYRRGQPLTNVEQRRAALDGFVVLTVETHASFVEYFKELLMEGERLVIEDAGPAPGSSVARRTPIADTGSDAGRSLLNKRFDLEFGGRLWELRYSADAAWIGSLPGRRHPDTALAGGLVISLLLAALTLAMATARSRALRLAEERTRVLRATQDNMAQGISVIDGQLRLIGHNRRFLELLGFPESLAGENATFVDFVRFNAERGEYGPGNIEDLVRARIDLARRFEPHRLKRTRPDGTVLEIVGKPLPGGGMVTTYSDITAQERAQEALRQSERRHRTLVEMSPDAVFAHRDGIVQLANPAAARLFGADSPEQLAGYDVRKLVAPEDLPRVQSRIASLASGQAAFVPPNEVRYLTLDGRRVEVESMGALIDLDGRPAVLTVARDIAERKRSETALRDSEARFRHIVEQSPISMAIVAMDGTIEFINRKAIETFGYLPSDIPDMARWWALAYPDAAYRDEVVAQWMGLVEKAIAENREIESRKYRVTCKDGSVKTAEIFGVPLTDKVFVMFDDISERERAAEQVLKERDFRQHLIESIPGIFYLFDMEGHYLLWNRNFEILTGYSAGEMKSLHPLDLFDGTDRNLIEERIGAVFSGNSATAEATLIAKDGGRHPFHFTGERIVLEDGRPGLVGVGIDMTERQRIEEALARQTAVLQATLEAMDQGISVVDADLRMNALNRKFCELLDFPEDMARRGADFADFVRFNALRGEYGPGDIEEKVREMVERAKLFQPHRFKRTRPNGCIIDIQGKPMPGGGFVTTYTDITEQEHAQEAVRRERDFRQHLIDSIPGIFFLFDPSGRFLLWNRNLESVLGMSAEEIAGSHTLALYDEADRDKIREVTKQVFATGASTTEATLLTRRGERIPYFISGLRIEVDGKQTVIGLGLDITERKLAEMVIHDLNDTLDQRVRERTAALEASNRELESFSYSVSHDLRAPLRALHGFSHLLEEEYAHRLDDNGLDYLRRIRSASQRMGDLIDDLINLARVSRQELKRGAIDLSQLAGEIAAVLAEQAPERAVVWNIAPGIQASADPLLMRVALENLLGNAWKFTAKCENAEIAFMAARQGDETVFSVRDNGAGFEMAYVDKLFKPFQRLHRPDEFAGTGIGLATVHRIVQRHGGRIWTESAPGRGAAFFFTLP